MSDPTASTQNTAHGTKVLRGLAPDPSHHPGPGRFGKMLPGLHNVNLPAAAATQLLNVIQTSDTSDNPGFPAGFTYLAQFVDHDLTFDPTPLTNKLRDPAAETNFRTPRLDLDSLYGTGPDDQPYLFESRDRATAQVKLLTGSSLRGTLGRSEPDLPRNAQGRALIGDPRNDENIIISQLHLLFINFHNKVVDRVRRPGLTGGDLYREARRVVCWHYQWIVVHDLLPRLVGDAMLTAVLERREHFSIRGVEPFIPVEFAGAAYRFGHSLVRGSYAINERKRVPIFAEEDAPSRAQHCGGFRQLPKGLVIDWSLFFELPEHPLPQPSRAIDANIAAPLWKLPADATGARRSLPALNLARAARLDVPPGQHVAEAMSLQPLDADQLDFGTANVPSDTIRDELMKATPLWYYVLREAAALEGGRRLGPMGGRIVAEVLVELLYCDKDSYLADDRSWTPDLGETAEDFTMSDLVRFVQG